MLATKYAAKVEPCMEEIYTVIVEIDKRGNEGERNGSRDRCKKRLMILIFI